MANDTCRIPISCGGTMVPLVVTVVATRIRPFKRLFTAIMHALGVYKDYHDMQGTFATMKRTSIGHIGGMLPPYGVVLESAWSTVDLSRHLSSERSADEGWSHGGGMG